VRTMLLPRFAAIEQARAESAALRVELDRVGGAADRLAARLDRMPITGATTVHAAHLRHPGVQAVFARRGLPACSDCAVGSDETIAEAALSEGMGLDDLLSELNLLVR
jgi:hypothetical protein